MINETEVDFQKLTSEKFEELCFDLVYESGYEAVEWRRGGADQGRDIQAINTDPIGLVTDIREKWFFECKNHSAGVNIDEISSKISWADALRPRHLVLFIVPYITTSTRTWLNEISIQKPYSIHLIEEPLLKKKLLKHPIVLEKYFGDPISRLVRDSMRTWLVHDIWPSLEVLYNIFCDIDVEKLIPSDIAFIFLSFQYRLDEYFEWAELNDDKQHMNFDFLFWELRLAAEPKAATKICEFDVYSDIGAFDHGSPHRVTYRMKQCIREEKEYVYCLSIREEDAIEFIMEKNSRFNIKIYYHDEGISTVNDRSMKNLLPCL